MALAESILSSVPSADDPRRSCEGGCSLSVLLRAIEHCPASIVITDRRGDIEYVNPKFTDVTGYGAEDVMGKNPRILKSGEMPSEVYAELWRTVLAGEEWSGLLHNRRKDGTLFWERAVISGLKEATGEIMHLVGVKEDITEQMRIQDELEHERHLLAALLDSFPDSIYFKDKDSRFLRMGAGMANRFGLRNPDEALGRTLKDFFSADFAAQTRADEVEVMRTGRPLVDKLEKTSAPGESDVWVMTTKLPLRSATGEIVGTFGSSKNITSLILAQQALTVSEARFRAVTETSQFGIIMINSVGIVTFWNESASRILGYTADEVIGSVLPPPVLPFPKSPDFRDAIETSQVNGESAFCGRLIELDARKKDGSMIPVEISLASFETGDTWHGVVIVHDVTRRELARKEREEMQIQISQAQKLESIGRLAAGIAHEINTPTQYIGDNVNFLRSAHADIGSLLEAFGRLRDASTEAEIFPDLVNEIASIEERIELDYLAEEIPRAIDQSLDGISRVSTIVLAMKTFSHPDGGEKRSVNLNAGIESTVTVARNEWKYLAEMKLQLEPSLPLVECHPGEFNQVILNLVINAAHAIAEKLGDGSAGKGQITVGTRRDGDWVEVRIADTGNGIPAHVKEKIFTPFFTTKPLGKGTGQGLALARSLIVEKLGGTITFESEEGVGTCFIIRLPLETEANSKVGESR